MICPNCGSNTTITEMLTDRVRYRCLGKGCGHEFYELKSGKTPTVSQEAAPEIVEKLNAIYGANLEQIIKLRQKLEMLQKQNATIIEASGYIRENYR